jgi:hypothetical protein
LFYGEEFEKEQKLLKSDGQVPGESTPPVDDGIIME